ncbi:MAG: DUF1697 domain-containing protein [Verrucomicrobiota bacterium]|nr:DUF1697 domain-containing protein [Verrucomicrobiota bacterium]
MEGTPHAGCKYLAPVRGVNVGGNALLLMSELKICFENAGFAKVRAYIRSGNLLFAAPKSDARIRQAEHRHVTEDDREKTAILSDARAYRRR